ncbi:MAG: hypothetical protein LBU65_02970 [Planctomycetaceae bacterium]|jgi:flagellar assembly protein FliH|nr:hypothetical protein [Planctomycetaceae bacterium]
MENTNVYRPVPFNFIDLETQANDYLSKVRDEALTIAQAAREEVAKLRETAKRELLEVQSEKSRVAQAKAELDHRLATENATLNETRKRVEEEAKTRGYEDGYKAGFAEGKRNGYKDGELQATIDYDEKIKLEASMQLGARLETLMPAVAAAVEKIQTAQQSFLADWEHVAINVAAKMASKAIMRDLPSMNDIPIDLLREALELGVGSSVLRIKMNPDDLDTLRPQVNMLTESLGSATVAEIIADGRISPGGCVVETSLGVIDQEIESRLERILAELV